MLPDWIVVVLKVRDYALWFGPPYLAALAVGAVLQMWWARRTAGPAPAPGSAAEAERAAPLQGAGVARSPAQSAYALWRRSLACGLAPAALLLPGYLNSLLLVARAGGTLLVGALMAVGAAFLGSRPTTIDRPAAPAGGPAPPVASAVEAGPSAGARAQFTLAWRYFRQAVDAELNRFLLGAVVGGLIMAWAPGLWLGEQLSGATLPAAILGAALGLALPLNGGAVVPVIAALITRGAGPAAVVALLVAAPLLNWWDLRPLVRQYSWPHLLVYVGLGLVATSLLGFALAQLPGSARLSSY